MAKVPPSLVCESYYSIIRGSLLSTQYCDILASTIFLSTVTVTGISGNKMLIKLFRAAFLPHNLAAETRRPKVTLLAINSEAARQL